MKLTREQWIEEMSQLGWEFACLEEYILENREKLLTRLKELQEKEPRD